MGGTRAGCIDDRLAATGTCVTTDSSPNRATGFHSGFRFVATSLHFPALQTSITTTVLCCSALLCLSACAEGGDEDRPQSEIKVTAQHHLFGFRSLRGFGSLPLPATVTVPDRGRLNLFDDSSYTITRGSGTSGSDRYAIEANGAFSVFVTGSGQEPSVVLRGAYGQTTGAIDFFFTDRVTTPASPSVGVYYGLRQVPGHVELEGAWHLLSLHAIFGQTLQSPDNVARGAFGAVTVTAGAPGTTRTISGTGAQGSAGAVFGGSIANDITGDNNGRCDLTVSYQVGAQPVDSRVMLGAATANLVVALDEDETDNEAGLLFMVRKFDPPTTPADVTRIAGDFLVGGHTFFVNPANAGSDAFVGVVTLGTPTGTQGSFRLDATGASGADFAYVGNYTLQSDGKLSIAINGTSETWSAAIDRDYRTLVFVDDFVEVRANNLPELNIGFGVREKSN